jgi:hypothetical protein
VLDVKTAEDERPDPFGSKCARLGYHRQAAIYSDAVQALYPDEDIFYTLAAAHSEPPYEAACYELDTDALDLGREQYLTTLADLVARRESGNWRADWQRGCQRIALPRWAFQE